MQRERPAESAQAAQKGKVGFLFHMGHGHLTQFQNFQECLPAEHAERAEWIPLYGDSSGDLLCRLRFLPHEWRYSRHQRWHAMTGIARHRRWDGLFFAAVSFKFLPFFRRHPCYVYHDLSPSLIRALGYDPPAEGNLLRAIKNRLQSRTFQAARGVFAMSRCSAEGIAQDYGVRRERLHISHPGANLKRWHFVDRRNRPANRPVRLLMVGGWFRLKGGNLLLEWAERTQAKNWELDIVTWPGQFPDWVDEIMGHPAQDAVASRSLAPRLPNVRIHVGIRANTPENLSLYEQADIYCHPTLADGTPIAILEAMATGLPVVASGISGIPEMVRDNETGLLHRAGDLQQMDERLTMLIEDASLRLKLGCAARQSCEDYFNVERQLREIFRVIDRDREAADAR